MFSKTAIWVVIALVLFTVFKQFDSRGVAAGVAPAATPRLSNCLNTVNSTRAITTQIAVLENILFTRTPLARTRFVTYPLCLFYAQCHALNIRHMRLLDMKIKV